MRLRLYSNPEGTGWLGWLESCKGQVVGFVRLDGSFVWDW